MAAIYYSKVNPLTSDYDYADYVGRSFNGRSLISDDDSIEDNISFPARSYFASIQDNKLFNIASTGFQIAMNAIDKVPQ